MQWQWASPGAGALSAFFLYLLSPDSRREGPSRQLRPVKDSHARTKPLALASGHGRCRCTTVTPERALVSVGEWPLHARATAIVDFSGSDSCWCLWSPGSFFQQSSGTCTWANPEWTFNAGFCAFFKKKLRPSPCVPLPGCHGGKCQMPNV